MIPQEEQFSAGVQPLTVEELLATAKQALTAIVAWVDGEWDNPELKKYGPLSVRNDDIKYIAVTTLETIGDMPNTAWAPEDIHDVYIDLLDSAREALEVLNAAHPGLALDVKDSLRASIRAVENEPLWQSRQYLIQRAQILEMRLRDVLDNSGLLESSGWRDSVKRLLEMERQP
ncbi:MAG: hypothetical protein Q8R28_14245 [Dehalococcoidia bacterium]|nr:hypothetical protein [Dehalococcoidia bacterium]